MKAVICGAGIAGLALAHRLDSIGWDFVMVEKAGGPRTQGYMIDFFGLGYEAAEKMGVLPRLKELGYQVEAATYVDAAGHRRGSMNYQQFASVVDGRLLVCTACVTAAPRCSPSTMPPTRPCRATPGPRCARRTAHWAGWFRGRSSCARSPTRSTTTRSPRSSCRAGAGDGSPLVGDACQAVSLLAGQGASLAIAGACVLATQLAHTDSVEEALTSYQRHWQPVVVDKQQTGRRGIEWFLPSTERRLRLRRAALKLMALPGLDRYLGGALVGKVRVPIDELAGGRQTLRDASSPRPVT